MLSVTNKPFMQILIYAGCNYAMLFMLSVIYAVRRNAEFHLC